MMLDVLSDGRPNLDETSETQLPKKTWESCINVSETEWDFLRYTTSSTRCSPFLAMAGVPLAILHVRSVFFSVATLGTCDLSRTFNCLF